MTRLPHAEHTNYITLTITLKHIIGKPLKPMGKFEKNFETDHLKTTETQGKFENILKHIILKPLKPMGTFEKFQTDNLKTTETYGEI